jgi:hypothetical protein
MAEGLTLQDFVPHLHTRFQVAGEDGCEVELTDAMDLSNASMEQFSLVFTGQASPWLPQCLYQLIHPQMGEFELFLVPIGPDTAGMRYEAAFSRLIR